MKPLEKTANDLFQHLRTRFSPVTIGDENAEVTTDPMAARFFSFVYEENGEPRGTVSVSIISNRSLKVYFSHDMVESIVNSNNWYGFLKELRFFAKQNLLSFDARDIQKDQLDTRDFEFIKKNDGPYKEQDVEITESAMYGSKKKSMQKFENATLVVYHKRTVDEEKRGSRSRHIDSIFIESNHERFRFPSNYLNGARAMAVHVSEGGTPYDAIGQHIVSTVVEMQNLAKFARMTRRHAMEDEDAAGIRDRVVETYHAIKRDIMRMQNVNNYRTFAETFEPTAAATDADVTALQEKFTRKVWNEQMNDLLPSVQRALEAKVDEADENATDQDYFEKVAVELGSVLGKTVMLQDYEEGQTYRGMNFVMNGNSIELFQTWKNDGTFSKPVTYLTVDGDEKNLGRFAVWWNNPSDYANDLASAMSDDVNEADIDENAFNQAAAAAARAGKDSFEFGGKTYKTKMDKDTAHKLNERSPFKDYRNSMVIYDPATMEVKRTYPMTHGKRASDDAERMDLIATTGDDYMDLVKNKNRMSKDPRIDEASPSVEKTIRNPNFVLLLKKDDAADNMIRTTKFTRADGLLSYIMSDIASRMIGDGADAVANFASDMSINIGDEGSSFGTKITPEYKRDKQLAMQLAKRYLDDIKRMATDDEYAATVRKDPKDVYGAKKKRDGGTHESAEAAFENWANEIFEATVGTTGTSGTTGTNSSTTNTQVVKALSGGDPAKARDIKRVSDKLARGQKLSPAEMPVAGEIAKSVMTTKKPTAAMQALAQDAHSDLNNDEDLVLEKTLRVKADADYSDDDTTDTQMGSITVDSDEDRKKRAQKYRDKKPSSIDEDEDLVRESLALLKRYAGL